jgi:DNA polymerase-3 subunit delta
MSPPSASPPVSRAERALWKAIQNRSFEGVYYFWGDDDYLKEQAVRQLVTSAVDPATRDFNLDIRSAADLDAAELDTLLGTPPLMAERRVVVLRDVGAMRREARQTLDRYLGASGSGVVLVLVATGGERAKQDKALQALPGAVEFAPLVPERVPRWIEHYVTADLKGTITPGAAALLARAVGNDLPALAAELDKLLSFTSGSEIDEDAVAAVVGVRHGETLGDFLDLVARRNAARALEVLPHVLALPKTTAVSVVTALATQTLAIAWGRARRAGGLALGQLEREYFDFLRSTGGGFTGRPWTDAVRAWVAAVELWDDPALDRALEHLLAADIALKETRVSSDEQHLATLVLAMCAGVGTANREPRTAK